MVTPGGCIGTSCDSGGGSSSMEASDDRCGTDEDPVYDVYLWRMQFFGGPCRTSGKGIVRWMGFLSAVSLIESGKEAGVIH